MIVAFEEDGREQLDWIGSVRRLRDWASIQHGEVEGDGRFFPSAGGLGGEVPSVSTDGAKVGSRGVVW